MFRLTIALAVLSCCSPTFDITRPISNAPDLVTWLREPRTCFTPCGMHALAGDCESLQRYEGRVLKRLAQAVPAWSEESTCAKLAGYELRLRLHDSVIDKGCPVSGWRLNAETCVSGLTSSAERSITVATTEWDHSALAHEIAHVADDVRPGHCPWKSVPFKAALYELSHRIEATTPEASCSP